LNELAASAVKQSAGAKLLAINNRNPDRQKIVAQYAGVAKLSGDAKRGQLLYKAACASCHPLKGDGTSLAPDLGTVAAKPTEQLIESLFDPNRAVEQRYLMHDLKLKDGTQRAGLILEENGNNVTLQTPIGVELILLKDIATRRTTTRSLMPEGLETVLPTPQDVADLLAWLRAR
jgi:putative heme-binding domain-containing protein